MENKNLATFKINDFHKALLTTDTVICNTCALSDTQRKAILFMYQNGVIRMTVDGCEFKRT